MAVVIRLARFGAKKKPFYRVVAADSRRPRDGRFLEVLGTYDPRNKETGLNLKLDDIKGWVSRGAGVSPTVGKLMRQCAREAGGAATGSGPA
jgi:small subunit ribosomal protein S16